MQDNGGEQHGWCVSEANQICQKDFRIPPKDPWW